MSTCVVFCSKKCNSASISDEIAPQSSKVHVYEDGFCYWEPLFQRSMTHCAIDSTWFPFDEQHCSLIYESWKYQADELEFIPYAADDDIEREGINLHALLPNGLWEIIGKLVCFCVYNFEECYLITTTVTVRECAFLRILRFFRIHEFVQQPTDFKFLYFITT